MRGTAHSEAAWCSTRRRMACYHPVMLLPKAFAALQPGPGRLPRFKSEEEELKFWDEHYPADWIEGPADVIVCSKPPCKPPSRRSPLGTGGVPAERAG